MSLAIAGAQVLDKNCSQSGMQRLRGTLPHDIITGSDIQLKALL